MLRKIDLFTVFFQLLNLQKFVWLGISFCNPHPPPPPLPHHTNVCKISRILGSCIYVSFQQITLTLGNFINFKAPFYVVSTDFPELSIHVKRLKKNRE